MKEETHKVRAIDGGPSRDRENGPLLRQNGIAMEGKMARFFPVITLLCPSIMAFTLLGVGNIIFTWGTFYDWVKLDQSTTQVIVQIVSHILGLMQVSTVCTVINLSTRVRSLQRPTSLQNLNLWVSLSTARTDLNLPWLHLIGAAAFVGFSFIPGALWAGAISPVMVNRQVIGRPLLPTFTDRSRPTWDTQFQTRGPKVWNINDNCTTADDRIGLISSCPVPTLQSLLLLAANSATTLDGEPRTHSKLDNPTWQYHGRSYGVGSAEGLLNNVVPVGKVSSYNYTESGYIANVSCIINSTSDFHFKLFETNNMNLSLYSTEGYLPNSFPDNPEYYPSVSWHNDTTYLATWATVVNDNRNMVAIAAGKGPYARLHQTQCEVLFTPTNFNVRVNTIEQSITVQPLSSVEAHDIEPTGHLSANVMHSVNLLSRMSSSLYVSILGEALNRNVERMEMQRPHLDLYDAVTLAVADSFTAIIDDILVAYGASQIIIANDAQFGTAVGEVEAAQIGLPLYRYLVFALNFLFIMTVSFEAIRTTGWRYLTKFNYLDTKSVVVASSAGGRGLAQAIGDIHRARATEWAGDPGDPIVCSTMVKLDLYALSNHTQTIAIVQGAVRNDGSKIESFDLGNLDRTV